MDQTLQFLTWLASLGPKIPQELAIIEDWLAATQDAVGRSRALFSTAPMMAAADCPLTLTHEQAELVAKIEAACPAGEGFSADGPVRGRLADLLAFLMAHPEILSFILMLFTKPVGTP